MTTTDRHGAPPHNRTWRATLRRNLRWAVGAGFVMAAVNNAIVLLPDAQATYAAFSRMAWLPPYRWLIDHVLIPHATAYTVGLLAIEVGIGLAALRRGRVGRIALLMATVFVVLLVPALAWPYFLVNIVVGAALCWLLVADLRAARSETR